MAVTTASASASLACEALPHLCTCQHGTVGGSGGVPLSPASSRTVLAALCSASASACTPAPAFRAERVLSSIFTPQSTVQPDGLTGPDWDDDECLLEDRCGLNRRGHRKPKLMPLRAGVAAEIDRSWQTRMRV